MSEELETDAYLVEARRQLENKNLLKAKELIFLSLRADRLNQEAMLLLRQVTGSKSKKAKYFRLLIEGVLDGKEFYTNYGVISESVDEALAFVKEFEPCASDLKIAKKWVTRDAEDELKGVERVFGMLFF